MVKISGDTPIEASFGVPSPRLHLHSYLLTLLRDNSLILLDASMGSDEPVQLSCKLDGHFRAYMGQDDCLHLVGIHDTAPSSPAEAHDLHWHSIDPLTGQTLASQQKHSWSISSYDLAQVHQARSRQVLAMVDRHSLAVMDATSLVEKPRCGPDLQILAAMPSGGRVLQQVAWSHSGSMLAAAYFPSRKDGVARGAQQPLVAVCVYDTATGCCLQSQLLLYDRLWSLQWSASQDILAVHCWRDPGFDSPTPGILLPSIGTADSRQLVKGVPSIASVHGSASLTACEGFIVLLDPSLQQASQVLDPPCDRPQAATNMGWSGCEWSFCG